MAHSHDHDHDDHDHSHHPGHAHLHVHGQSTNAILKAIGVTAIFMLIELGGGVIANSLALISDGAHMLTDVGAMLLSLFAIWISRRPSTPRMSFGYQRAEILGALISGLTIWFIAGLLVYEAVRRLQNPPEVRGMIVFVVATIGLAANLLSMKMLHSAKEENLNVKAAYLHMLSDSLGSVSAIIAGVILILTGWKPIDPIVTIVFAALMFFSSFELVKEAVGVLMESTPRGLDPAQVRDHLRSLDGVQEVHDLHIWTVSSGKFALSVHLIAIDQKEGILILANDLLKKTFGIVHTTIQIEHPDRFDSARCYDCDPVARHS